MANTHINHPENESEFVETELMDDFFYDFREAHQSCESILINLEHDPSNKELLNGLFRSIHTIKGNLVYVGFRDLTPLIQSMEDLLDAIRSEQIKYDSLLSDVILLAMDKTKQMVQARLAKEDAPISEDDLIKLCQNVSSIAEVSGDTRTNYIRQAITSMDPSTHLFDSAPPVASIQQGSAITEHKQHSIAEILERYQIETDEDINFFASLSAPMENRSLYWKGRTCRLLTLALAMNQRAGEPVESTQLTAAILLHDIGMAFLPLSLLHKAGAFNEEERNALFRHTESAYQLLSQSRKWEQAATIVQQHHEKVDGSGYPKRLTGVDICDGAKILSIVDTFDARSHERAYNTRLKRPFIRAVIEVNNCKGSQFDASWVDVFNEITRESNNTSW
ncbi:phosphohydrolase [Gammaproteobacteria bacterium 45_16_T64]|nr:phosphohydrolase [Gammaproteobacteria bacterium 45_16_T64]